jgi:hypothetical protein
MNCTKCHLYSFQLSRCKAGKINPKTIKGGVDAARFMGFSYICSLSPLKKKIMEKMVHGKPDGYGGVK